MQYRYLLGYLKRLFLMSLGLRPCFQHKEKIKQQRVAELPEEIIVEILLKLPLKKIIQFSCVSKKWRSLILHDPQFSKTHFKVASQHRTLGQSLLVTSQIKLPSTNYGCACDLSNPKFQSLQDLAGDHHVPNSFLPSPFKNNHEDATVKLLGSCNGLVCISIGTCSETKYHENVHIWNPSTGFFRTILEKIQRRRHGIKIPQQELARELPHLLLQQLDDEIILFAHTGFGYVNATDDYTYVVLATETECSAPFTPKRFKAAFFSLRTKCWKCIDAPSNIRELHDHDYPGVYLNESLHWITKDVLEMEKTVTAVDLGKEEFRQMPLPPDLDHSYFCQNQTEVLVRLKDCLCLWRSDSRDIQFWVMREYNVDESWNLLYSFRTADLPANVVNRRLRPVFVTESGTFVLKVFRMLNLRQLNNLTDFEREYFLIRIECHEEKKPVCSNQHIFEEFQAIQYDQTLLSAWEWRLLETARI